MHVRCVGFCYNGLTMDTPTDEQLVGEYLAGDEQAFRSLVRRYLKPIYNFAYRYVGKNGDAADITQDTFVKAWKHIGRFDRDKKFKTWIFTIAKNTSLNWIKKKRPFLFSDFSVRHQRRASPWAGGGSAFGGENEDGGNTLTETLADPAPLPEELFEHSDLSARLSDALNELNPDHRAVLLLYYNDHFTFQEISESLGKPIDTVKSQHRRALMKLRKIMHQKTSSICIRNNEHSG